MTANAAVLVGAKGRGSNMEALVTRCREIGSPVRIERVIGPSAHAPAIVRASELGVETVIVPYGEDFGPRLVAALEGVEWLCLAGFMKLLPTEVLAALPNRVLNIHPALLPKFGGKGMYGHHVHEAVVAAGEVESGCTVHLVNEHYDEGRVLLRRRCPVTSGMTADDVAAAVLKLEHEAYAGALKAEVRARSS